MQLDDKYVYRISLKYFCDLGNINFPTKVDLKTQYLETIVLTSKFWGWEYKKLRTKKHTKCRLGCKNLQWTGRGFCFLRQFDWMEILLVYDKSNKHLTIYDSYNAEFTTRMIKTSSYQIHRMHTVQQTQWNSILMLAITYTYVRYLETICWLAL